MLKRVRGIPAGINSPAGTGTGKKLSPMAFVGTGLWKIFPRWDEDGDLTSDGEFPVDISMDVT